VAFERFEKATLIIALTMALLMVFGLGFRAFGIYGAPTDSEPNGLYRTTSGPITRGGMVELRKLIKHVAGVPGDTVRVTPEGSYINGKLWPYSAIPNGTPYTHFPYGTYKLAPGQFWLLGHNPLSWDSRYLGPIPQDMINSAVKPFWTISNGYAPGTHPW
jgi:type IV secretory pathway protease TraF